ncbi:MAG: methyltransferase [DPANN group archaeon]|nr:methyltransferase [DPANN group archaeon]
MSRSSIAIALSKLKVFENPQTREEQYPTDSEVAADMLWNAAMIDGMEGKCIADLGCGTGILGIGALLLGAAEVVFVDRSPEALKVLRTNLSGLRKNLPKEGHTIVQSDVERYEGAADLVIMNPPFGTREKHADRRFLEKAFDISPVVYSIHKKTTIAYLERYARARGFLLTHRWDHELPIKATMPFHLKKRKRIQVSVLRFTAER